ncbi:sugar ABC transporter permease [Thermatribacter velox]|uniref:Sugar ABC transporter permease n=1 Tax=Thermatribacter velox TaxID=3039681 RepID=A0ABZ2Y8X4_9BACT
MFKKWNPKSSNAIFGLLLIAPLLVWLLVTIGYPLFLCVKLSFLNVEFIGEKGVFVGLKNYINVVLDASLWHAFRKSLFWVIGNVALQTILGFFAALILNLKIRSVSFMRTWIVLPWILPTVVLAIMWRWMLSGTFGVINYLLEKLGVISQPINYLGSINEAMPALIFINSWRWFPFITVLLLAALQSVPQQEYEAAAVDGANSLQSFFYVTLPNLKPVMTVLGILGPLLTFNVFDVVWLLTQGGPSRATYTVPVLIYERGFKAFALSEAATISVIAFVFLAMFVVVYLLLTKMSVSEYARE